MTSSLKRVRSWIKDNTDMHLATVVVPVDVLSIAIDALAEGPPWQDKAMQRIADTLEDEEHD